MYGSPPCTTLHKRYSKQRVRRNSFQKKEKARKAILRRTYTRFVRIRRRDFEPQGGEQIERQGRRIVQATAPIFRSDGVHCNSFNVISPLPFGLSPIAQIYVIFLLKQTSFARGELGTRIDRDISLIMSLRFVRQLRNNTAQSLVLFVELGAKTLVALRLELRISTYRV